MLRTLNLKSETTSLNHSLCGSVDSCQPYQPESPGSNPGFRSMFVKVIHRLTQNSGSNLLKTLLISAVSVAQERKSCVSITAS